MKSVRSVLLCAALAGALSVSAAEPVGTVRVKSFGAVLAAVRDAATLAGQPFAAVMAESMIRAQFAQTGVSIREDDPILFAMVPDPVADGEAGAADAMAMMADPPAMAVAIPLAPLPAELLGRILGSTNAPAPGEWAAGENGKTFYSYRDGYAVVALKEGGRALADGLLASESVHPGALFEMSLEEPAEFKKRTEFGGMKEEVVSAAFDEIAETLGLPGFGEKIKVLADAAEKADAETERFDVDVWFDATNGFVATAARVAREGSDLAARAAAAPALDPAALPGVPAGAPFWAVQASPDSPDGDAKALFGAIRGLFEGPAPSGDETATAQRAAAVRWIDATVASIPALGAMSLYFAADEEGRPVFVAEQRLRDAAPARAVMDAEQELLATFPALASNGVAVVREAPGVLRIDVSTAEAFVAVARLGYELEKLENECGDGSDLWTDEEDEEEEVEPAETAESTEPAEPAEPAESTQPAEAAASTEPTEPAETAESVEETAEEDEEEEFDEEEVRQTAKQFAEAVGETISLRDAIAEDGSSETFVASVPGAKLPEAKGSPDLAPALALKKEFLPGDARLFGAGGISIRAAAKAFLPAFVRLSAAMDDPMDEDAAARLKAFAEGETDFEIRVVDAIEGRSLVVAVAVPREGIEAVAKLAREAAEASGDDAGFDLDDEDGDETDGEEAAPAAEPAA